MATTVSATPNIVQLTPAKLVTAPATYTTVGAANAVAALSTSGDSAYVQTVATPITNVSDLFRVKCSTTALPTGARLIYARPVARAYRSGAAKRSWIVALGGYDTKGTFKQWTPYAPATLNSSAGQYSGPPTTTQADHSTLIDQAAISRGLGVIVGELPAGPADTAQFRTTTAYVELSYDKPPTANYTGPTGTISDTSSPVITWDYTDDLQPQAKYRVVITSGTTTAYDSGIVSSTDTFHQVSASLPNGTYSASVLVYQKWSGAGGSFPANKATTGTFTLAVASLPTPNLVSTVGINSLITGDASNFNGGTFAGWTSTGGVNMDPAAGYTKLNSLRVKPATTAYNSFTIPAAVDYPMTLSLKIKLATGVALSDLALSVGYYDASSHLLTTSNTIVSAGTSTSPADGGSWYTLSVSDGSILPSTAVTANVSITNNNATGYMWADDILLTPWNPDGMTDLSGAGVTLFANTHVNYLNRDDSSFDQGIAGWQATALCTISAVTTPVADGTQALKVTGTGSGTMTIAQTPAAVQWLSSTNTFGIGVKTAGPSTLTNQYVQLGLICYDANFNVLGTVANGAPPLQTTSSPTYSWYTFNGNVLTGTAYVSVQISFWNGGSGKVWYVDDVLLTDYADANVPWSRGGLINTNFNVLSYDDSTIGANHNWVGDSNTTVVLDTAQARQGTTALKMTATATGTINAVLGNSTFFGVDITQNLQVLYALYSTGHARSSTAVLSVYDATFTLLGTLTSSATTTTLNAWTTATNAFTSTAMSAYPTAVYGSLTVSLASAVTADAFWLDTVAVYPITSGQSSNAATLGWQHGAYPNTDAAPVLDFQQINRSIAPDGTETDTVLDLGTTPLLNAAGQFNPIIRIPDYMIASKATKNYYAVLDVTQNGAYYTSANGTGSATLSQLYGLWLCTQDNPAGTLVQYGYDGAGRSETLSLATSTTPVDGRTYGFVQYGTQQTASIDFTVTLVTDDSGTPTAAQRKAVLDRFAKYPGNIVARDSRGRMIVGPMSALSYTDESYGFTATFTITASEDVYGGVQ